MREGGRAGPSHRAVRAHPEGDGAEGGRKWGVGRAGKVGRLGSRDAGVQAARALLGIEREGRARARGRRLTASPQVRG